MTEKSNATRKLMERFNNAFEAHRPDELDDLIGEGCVLENTTPAPDGARYEGREACLTFWKGVASNADLVFEPEDIWTSGDRGIIRWQLRWSGNARPIGCEASTSCASATERSSKVWDT